MPPRARNAIGPRIRELRMERGLTLDDLAKAAGISASHLSRLERGQTVPSFTVAAAIARVIGVLPSDLVAIQHEQAGIDDALIAILQSIGLSAEMSKHICDGISTRARAALLDAIRRHIDTDTASSSHS